jgi:hypothetical protein
MRRAMRRGLALASMTVVAGLAVPAYAAPAEHFVEDVTGDTIECASTTYTITSGSIQLVVHEGTSNTGNLNFTGTGTPQNVVAEDTDGNEVTIRGAFWFGGTFNVQRETDQFWTTEKLQLVDETGSVDSLNVTFFIQVVDGEVTNIKDFDFGTCGEPQ